MGTQYVIYNCDYNSIKEQGNSYAEAMFLCTVKIKLALIRTKLLQI